MAAPTPRPRLWIFLAWLAAFYTGWLTILTVGNHWQALTSHWPMALTMLFGSYVAGSTPMGGGTVGFPVLVLLFDQSPLLGRDFSFAVQSIGMVSAGIFILVRRQEVAWRMLVPALLGSLVGTPLGILYVAPHVQGVVIKVLFAVVWASFGILTAVRLRALARQSGLSRHHARVDRIVGVLVGLFGGAFVAATTGVGIDMLIYSALVLVRQCDLKIAIPTSVILMAFNSLVGIATKALIHDINPEVFPNWLAAAPVVALGAPLGVFVVAKVGRVPTLAFVAALCLFQFVWTYYENWGELGLQGLALGVVALLAFQGLFHLLFVLGRKLAAAAPGFDPEVLEASPKLGSHTP